MDWFRSARTLNQAQFEVFEIVFGPCSDLTLELSLQRQVRMCLNAFHFFSR